MKKKTKTNVSSVANHRTKHKLIGSLKTPKRLRTGTWYRLTLGCQEMGGGGIVIDEKTWAT